MNKHKPRFIFSAGGTGGHIFPALATADALREMLPEAEILFIGAEKRMEMEKVPHHGYAIIGLPIRGLQRKLSLKNLSVPFRIIRSLRKAKRILKDYKPSVVAGFGGYASGPVLRKAARLHIPTLLQEQNSFPGLTNRILAKKAHKICVAYSGMEQFFDAEKIVITGNPVRSEICQSSATKEEARTFFGLDPAKPTVLAIGGSLGARTINESVCGLVGELVEKDMQLIWQTGRSYAVQACEYLYQHPTRNVIAQEFIYEMPMAYAAADIIISRAGAIAVSEIAVTGKPSILIPSPNVTDDHQTKNALALVEKNAALMIRDAEARTSLKLLLFELAENKDLQIALSAELGKLAMPEAARNIAREIIALADLQKK